MQTVATNTKWLCLISAVVLVLFLTFMTSTAAAQSSNGNFTVNIDESKLPSNINEGGSLNVTFDVENIGSNSGTKEVILEDNEGEEINRTRLSLGSRNSKTITREWEGTPERPTREIFPTVRTPDDVDSEQVNVTWSEFVITDFTAESLAPSNGTNVALNYTIQNIGTEQNKTNIIIENNEDAEISNYSTRIAPTIDTSFLHEVEQTPGEYTYELTTENSKTGDDGDTQTASVTIPNTGAVAIERSYYDDWNDHIVVEATIENQAGFAVNQKAKFSVDGKEKVLSNKKLDLLIDDKKKTDNEISLDSGESKTVKFLYDETSTGFTKQITVGTNAPDTESTEVNGADVPIGPQITDVSPQRVTGGEEVSVTYDASGDVVESATLSIIDPDWNVVAERQVPVGTDETASLRIPDDPSLIDGQYDVRLDATDTVDRTSTTIAENEVSVATEKNPDAVGAIGEPVYRAPAGGFVEISTDGEYMLVGGDTNGDGIPTQYLDILHVEEDSTMINTRLIGTDNSSEEAYGEGVTSYAHEIGADSKPDGVFEDVSFQGASTLAEFRDNVGISPRSTPLQTGRYRLLAGANGQVTISDGTPTFASPVGRSNLVLTQPQLEAVNTYVLPPASANQEDVAGPSEDAIESNTIAAGERLLIELQATGFTGATTDLTTESTPESIPADDIARLLNRQEGVEMDLSTWYYDGAANTEADLRFDGVSSGDVYVIPDETTDQWDNESRIGENTEIGGLYIVVDTRSEAFSPPAYGDVMEFETRYESPEGERYLYPDVGQGDQPPAFSPAVSPNDGVEHFPYFGDSDTTVTANSTIEYMEPSIQYGRMTVDDELIVPSESDGQILGSTTMAPGTEATIQFIDQSRPDPELVTIEEVTVEDDRTFTASADFSALSSGDQVTVEFYTAGRLPNNRVIDRRSARVVDDLDNIANYQITNLTTPVEVQQRSSLGAIEATINNTGELTGQQVVRFSIDGEPIRNESLRLSGNGTATLDLSDQFVTLPVGTYEYTVQTDNDERTGELRVTEPESGTTITSEDTNTATTNSPLDENEVPDENDENTDPSGIFGLVGVSGRDVALGATLTGAAHVLGYWA